MRRYITCKENACRIIGNHKYGANLMVAREESLVDEFVLESSQPAYSDASISVRDPLYMAFNAERLKRMGATAAQSFVDSLKQQTAQASSMMKDVTDEHLLMCIKDRNVQTISELQAYSKYMQDQFDTFSKRVQDAADSLKKKEEEEDKTVKVE